MVDGSLLLCLPGARASRLARANAAIRTGLTMAAILAPFAFCCGLLAFDESPTPAAVLITVRNLKLGRPSPCHSVTSGCADRKHVGTNPAQLNMPSRRADQQSLASTSQTFFGKPAWCRACS